MFSPRCLSLSSSLMLVVSVAVAQQPAPAVQWSSADQVASRRAQSQSAWLPLFSTSTLSVGRYRIAKGGTDGQRPHARDEVYYVVAGKARLEAGGETRSVEAGDTVFVAARVEHRFLDVEEDLDVLVFFSSARASTGGMAAAPPPTEQTPFAETSQRGNARIFYWFGPDSAGQVAIDFGRPRWQSAYGAFLSKANGQRWRLGQNFWTTLDTNMQLTIAGVEVAVGQYYLVLQTDEQAKAQLVLLDPAAVRRGRLDAYEAGKTTGGLVVPLTASTSDTVATELDLELTVDADAKDRATLTVRFGPHVLTAPVIMHPDRG